MRAIPGGVDKVTHPNAKVNKTMHKVHGGSGAPRNMAAGFDLSGDATNCIDKNPHLSRAESPNSRRHSFNQHTGGR